MLDRIVLVMFLCAVVVFVVGVLVGRELLLGKGLGQVDVEGLDVGGWEDGKVVGTLWSASKRRSLRESESVRRV